jgi:plasmid maintenance system antidote protein VapI
MTRKDLAGKMKVTVKTLNGVINGDSPITKEVAAILERAFSVPASFWLSREKQYREFLSHQKKPAKLKEATSLVVTDMLKIKKATPSVGAPARHRI